MSRPEVIMVLLSRLRAVALAGTFMRPRVRPGLTVRGPWPLPPPS